MKRLLCIALALMLITAGVALAEAAPIADGTITASLSGDQTALTVELVGNATTGYEWIYTYVVSDPLTGYAPSPEALLTLASSEYVTDEAAGADRVGAGGKSVFVLESAKKGTGVATLAFAYKRAWEEEALLTYELSIQVNEAGQLCIEGLRKSPRWMVGEIVTCPGCGAERAEVVEVINAGEEDGGTLWVMTLRCPACGRVDN